MADVGLALDVTIAITGSENDERCALVIEAEGLPAYDPATDRIVTLDRFYPQMSYSLGTLDLVWIDAGSGETVERMKLARGGYAESGDCAVAQRFTGRALRRARRRLAAVAYEPMPAVPVAFIGWSDMYFEGMRLDKAETLAAGEEWIDDRPSHVEAFIRDGDLVVRRRGVEILERVPTWLTDEPSTLHAINGHRGSGVVLFTEIECAGEDCSCDPATSHLVHRFGPRTLAQIDAHPCDDGEDSSRGEEVCEIMSAFANGEGDPWEL